MVEHFQKSLDYHVGPARLLYVGCKGFIGDKFGSDLTIEHFRENICHVVERQILRAANLVCTVLEARFCQSDCSKFRYVVQVNQIYASVTICKELLVKQM